MQSALFPDDRPHVRKRAGSIDLHHGDCLKVMRDLVAAGVTVDAVVTDAPYHLSSIHERWSKTTWASRAPTSSGPHHRAAAGFMGQKWDGGDVAFDAATWQLALMLLKPGGYLLCFGGTRTYHRVACAIEDAGADIRDTIMWLYGSGFPKSHNMKGAHEGFGTALKPAVEPIVLAQRPFDLSVDENVARHGVGALNIDACRVGTPDNLRGTKGPPYAFGGQNPRPFHYKGKALAAGADVSKSGRYKKGDATYEGTLKPGRWPANVIHDGSPDVLEAFARAGEVGADSPVGARNGSKFGQVYGDFDGAVEDGSSFQGDKGTADRFFYCAKAGARDRVKQCTVCKVRALGAPPCGCQDPDKPGEKAPARSHPTIKPVALMEYLLRLVVPPGGVVLDPFAGTGSTGAAAKALGMGAHLIEQDADYFADMSWRLTEGTTNAEAGTPKTVRKIPRGRQRVAPTVAPGAVRRSRAKP